VAGKGKSHSILLNLKLVYISRVCFVLLNSDGIRSVIRYEIVALISICLFSLRIGTQIEA
jgi:hypothetical protein